MPLTLIRLVLALLLAPVPSTAAREGSKTDARQLCHRSLFYGNDAFRFINEEGLKQPGRYQILPVAAQHYLTDEEVKAKSPNFLFEELRTQLAQEPIKFRLLLQLPNSGESHGRCVHCLAG